MVAVVVLLSFLLGGTPCAGWELSSEARRDCCEPGHCPDHMGGPTDPAGPSQDAADRCCAAGEQKQQQDRSQSPVRPVPVAPVMLSIVVPEYLVAQLHRPGRAPLVPPVRSAPLHVLLSVFLI